MQSRPVLIAAGVVLGLVLAGGGFVAGMTVGGNNAKAEATASTRQRTVLGQGAAGSGAADRPVVGQVLAVGDGTITVQLAQDQGSRIVLVAPSTRVTKTTETDIKLADIKPGDRVTVLGQANSDGSVNAQTVVVGNLAGVFVGGGGARPGPSASPTR